MEFAVQNMQATCQGDELEVLQLVCQLWQFVSAFVSRKLRISSSVTADEADRGDACFVVQYANLSFDSTAQNGAGDQISFEIRLCKDAWPASAVLSCLFFLNMVCP